MNILIILSLFGVLVLSLGVIYLNRHPIRRWITRRDGKFRAAQEDILKYLIKLGNDCGPRDTARLAVALDLPPNQIHLLMKQLQFNGLVEQLGSTYRLTQDGREVALNIIRAHRAYERFLADQTGYPQDEWHARAELAEHQFKDAELDTLLSQLGNPAFDPHGDPIPTAAGEIPDDPGNQLSQLTAGYAGQIVHLEDEPPRIYQDLLDHGLAVGVEIYILESSPTRHVIWIEGEEVALRPDQSMNIYLLPLPDWDIHDHITGKQLSSLRPGEAGIVQHISPFLRGHERRRLMDLGLVPGTYIRSEYESPSGEPVAYQIRGALIALRKEQTDHIRISGIVEN